jgi:copper chaperone CopZ
MKIQLIHFQGCPNIEAARSALREALAAEKLDLPVEEIDVEDPSAPAWSRGWGSPTILIDGDDVAGQRPTDAASCRIYAGGAPAADTIRRRLAAANGRASNGPRVAIPIVGAVTAAVAASACCLIPCVLAIVGVSGAGVAARIAPYRPYLLAATGVALAAGFWFAYRRRRDDCGCAVPRRRRAGRVGLWITTLVTIGLAAYPLLGSTTATTGSSEAAARASLDLKISGMDCKECASTIASAIHKVPGVVWVRVDYDTGNAIVRYDGREGMTAAAIKAVEDAGYSAEVSR